ncbi:hypothetical protein OG521_00240 [Streptomyces sp. NBC_01463]
MLQAPEDGVPVLFVGVDNHTEPAAVVARKWHSAPTPGDPKDGLRDYTGTVPVIATTLTRLHQHGPLRACLVALRTLRLGNHRGRPGQP